MTTAEQMQADSPLEAIRLGIAQLNGKMDVLAASHNSEREQRKDLEVRMRVQESRPAVPPEVEARLRELEDRLRSVEDRRTVSPGQLWAAVLGLLALILTAYPAVSDYFRAVQP